MADLDPTALQFPHPAPPEPGGMIEVAPGVRWLRLALPFALDHVNVYLIADGDGWALVDTGVDDARTREAWQAVLAGALDGRRVTRLIVTHFHPDHIGLAGWLTGRLGVELLMTQVEYLISRTLQTAPAAAEDAVHASFFRRHGMAADVLAVIMGRGMAYLRMTSGVPARYRRLVAGETLTLGERRVEILTGAGHAPEQAMLLDRDGGVFLAADQVLARISPNVSVGPWEPEADALGDYLRSLAALRLAVPADVLVLPAHNLPFFGLHRRIAELEAHHEQRCAEIVAACHLRPMSAADLLPVLFHRPLDPQQAGFAFGEVLAHVNLLLRRGALVAEVGADGVVRQRAEGALRQRAEGALRQRAEGALRQRADGDVRQRAEGDV